MTFLKSLFIKYKEIIAYLFWGVLTTIVSWGSFSICSLFLNSVLADRKTLLVFLANTVSWICATAFAFVTNKLWVFNSRKWDMKTTLPEIVKFTSSRLITGSLELVCVPLLVNVGLNQPIFGIEGMLSKIIVSIIVVILNYLISKILIFKDKD